MKPSREAASEATGLEPTAAKKKKAALDAKLTAAGKPPAKY
jgi:hypothetical protein